MAGICSRMSDTDFRVDAQPLSQGHGEEPSKNVEKFGQGLLLRIVMQTDQIIYSTIKAT